MGKVQSRTRHTTSRKELLGIMRDSYLFESDKAARYALGAVCASIRAWLLAMTDNPAKGHLTSLRLPGVGTLRCGWIEYERHSPKLWVRFRPLRPIARHIEHLNRVEYANWKENNLSGMPVPPNKKEPL
jgi:hypothetical protein